VKVKGILQTGFSCRHLDSCGSLNYLDLVRCILEEGFVSNFVRTSAQIKVMGSYVSGRLRPGVK
jgi:hypothetical protein